MILLNRQELCFAGRAAIAVGFLIYVTILPGCSGVNGKTREKCSEQVLIEAKTTIDKNVDISNPVSQGKADAVKKDLDKSWDDYKAGRIKCKDFMEIVDYHMNNYRR